MSSEVPSASLVNSSSDFEPDSSAENSYVFVWKSLGSAFKGINPRRWAKTSSWKRLEFLFYLFSAKQVNFRSFLFLIFINNFCLLLFSLYEALKLIICSFFVKTKIYIRSKKNLKNITKTVNGKHSLYFSDFFLKK